VDLLAGLQQHKSRDFGGCVGHYAYIAFADEYLQVNVVAKFGGKIEESCTRLVGRVTDGYLAGWFWY
jgi:hypothetical protein